MAEETAGITGTRYPYRIQVRLNGDARANLDRYRAARGGLSISQAVRELCLGAQLRPTRGSFAGRGRLARFEEAGSEVVPFAPRVPLRAGRRPGGSFIQFFMRPSDIGVRLDQASWNRLCLFAERRGLSISQAVRLLCVGAVPRFVGSAAGRRHRFEGADPWED